MTFEHDTRDQAQAPDRLESQREAARKLEQDAELKQLATDAVIAFENPNDTLRVDLQRVAVAAQGHNERLTNVGATAIAEHIVQERADFARTAEQKLLAASLPTPSHDGKVNISLPAIGPDEQLAFDRVANTQDIARAGLSSVDDLNTLKQGTPLVDKNNPSIVIGPAPGDLHTSADYYAQLRQHSAFEGNAIYRIVKRS